MLSFEATQTGYRLLGEVDEEADFSQLPEGALELDLSGIRRVNSTGIRNWIRWKERLAQPPVLRDVPSILVLELSMLPDLSRGTKIRSIRAPYAHPVTGERIEVLFEGETLAWIRDHRRVPPQVAPDGATQLEFDEDENNYFEFLHNGAEVAGK